MIKGKCFKLTNIVILFFIGWVVITTSGCGTTHFARMNRDFKDKRIAIKTIGFLMPIDYAANREGSCAALEDAIVDSLRNDNSYRLKLIRQNDYLGQWDSNIERAASGSREFLIELELEKLWKDKKNQIISRKFLDDVKLFKTLDPELDALLLIKCKQHYGNPWAAGFYAFGALGGLVAAASAEEDNVIGRHAPADNDSYGSAILVDLNTAEILWYNFALRYGLNVAKEKDAKTMAKDMLFGLLNPN